MEEVHELTRPRSLSEPHSNLTAIRSGLLLHQAVEDGDPADFEVGREWPRFFYGFELDRVPEFEVAPPCDAAAIERPIEGLRAWPAELFVGPRRGLIRSLPPTRVFASLAHLKGREIRNPAFGVLVRHGLLSRGQDYRGWLGTVSERRAGIGVLQDPRWDRSEAGRLRGLIESHVVADRTREAALLDELETVCL